MPAERISTGGGTFPGNSVNDNNVLDNDPNHPAAITPNAVRVFPGSRVVVGVPGPALDKVDVKVTLSVDPVEPVDIYFTSLDMDDPTASNDKVDTDGAPLGADGKPVSIIGSDRDNRGSLGAGKIVGSDAAGLATISFTTKEKTFEFQTTMQPGDKFRIVGNEV